MKLPEHQSRVLTQKSLCIDSTTKKETTECGTGMWGSLRCEKRDLNDMYMGRDA